MYDYTELIERVVRLFIERGVDFKHSDSQDGTIHSITTEPLPCRIANDIYQRISKGQNGMSVLQIGAGRGKTIINVQVVMSEPEPARLTVGELIERLSKFNPDTELVCYSESEAFDGFLSDVILSKVVEDDMYGNFLDEFHTEDQSVCSDEKPGKEFVVLFTQ